MFDVDFNSDPQGELEMNIDEIVNLKGSEDSSTEEEKVDDSSKEKVDNTDSDELNLSIDEIIKLDSIEDSEVKEDNTEEIKPSSATKETANSFLLLSKALAEEGILSEFDEEGFGKLVEETGSGGKALLQLVNARVEEMEKSIKETYEEDYKTYLQLKESGVPQDEAFELTNLSSQLEQIDDDILEESEETRRSILEMHFKNTTKWDDARISKHIDKLVTNGEDIDEAKEALPELQKHTKEAIQSKQSEYAKYQEDLAKQQEEAAKDIRDTFKADAEIVKGVKLTKTQAIKAQELLLTPVELEDGTVTNRLWAERAKNPLEFDKKIAALWAAGALEGNITTAKASKKVALDELDKVLKTGSKSSFKGNTAASTEVIDEQKQLLDDKFMRSIRRNNG